LRLIGAPLLVVIKRIRRGAAELLVVEGQLSRPGRVAEVVDHGGWSAELWLVVVQVLLRLLS